MMVGTISPEIFQDRLCQINDPLLSSLSLTNDNSTSTEVDIVNLNLLELCSTESSIHEELNDYAVSEAAGCLHQKLKFAWGEMEL